MSILSGVGGALLSGSGLGLLGGIATQIIGIFQTKQMRKNRRLDYKHDTDKWEHESKLLELQMQADRQRSENELELAQVAGSYAGLKASAKAQQTLSKRASVWVVDILAFIRPVLTLALIGYTGYLAMYAGLGIAQEQAVGLTGLVVAWWFGDRSAGHIAERYLPDKEKSATP